MYHNVKKIPYAALAACLLCGCSSTDSEEREYYEVAAPYSHLKVAKLSDAEKAKWREANFAQYYTAPADPFSKHKINVIGQVVRQGSIYFPPDEEMTLTTAITISGGLTRLADVRNIRVKRKMPDGSIKTYSIDFGKKLSDKDADDFLLQNGDIIEMSERCVL